MPRGIGGRWVGGKKRWRQCQLQRRTPQSTVKGRMNARLLDVRASLGRGVATSDGGSGAETDTGSGKHDD